MTVIRRAGLDPNAAFLPNAIALVREHIASKINVTGTLVPNRPLCMASREGEATPGELWAIAERFVSAQTWSNKSDVLDVLRQHLKVRVGGQMVTLEKAQQMLQSDAENPFGGYAGG